MNFIRVIFIVVLVSGCSYIPLADLSDSEIRSHANYLSLLRSKIKGFEEYGADAAYRKWQLFDAVVGFGDLQKPKLYAEQYCKGKGGDFKVDMLSEPPIAYWEPSFVHVYQRDNLGGYFGRFSCSSEGVAQWSVEVGHTEVESVRSLRGDYGTFLLVKYSEGWEVEKAALQSDLVGHLGSRDAEKRLVEAFRWATRNSQELKNSKPKKPQDLPVGSSVCQSSMHMGSPLVLYGTVEQVAGERLKVFVERAILPRTPGISPGGFKQHHVWVSSVDVETCSLVSN